jgi:Icc-related predicted phosphoesterase
MQLTFISDTHGKHRDLVLGSGDVLIHCGDFTRMGEVDEVEDFADFISMQNFHHKIVIAGNHDWCFEDNRRAEAEKVLTEKGIIYLNDSGIEIAGKYFWGSPIQPEFCDWAFNRPRGKKIAEHWQLIPKYTDVLITHGPAFGYLDECYHGERVGCEELAKVVFKIKPSIHAFGHIHEDYGTDEKRGVLFVNACSLNEDYELANPPITVQLD